MSAEAEQRLFEACLDAVSDADRQRLLQACEVLFHLVLQLLVLGLRVEDVADPVDRVAEGLGVALRKLREDVFHQPLVLSRADDRNIRDPLIRWRSRRPPSAPA